MRAWIGHPFLLAQYNDAQCARYDTPCPTGDYPTGGYAPVGTCQWGTSRVRI